MSATRKQIICKRIIKETVYLANARLNKIDYVSPEILKLKLAKAFIHVLEREPLHEGKRDLYPLKSEFFGF